MGKKLQNHLKCGIMVKLFQILESRKYHLDTLKTYLEEHSIMMHRITAIYHNIGQKVKPVLKTQMKRFQHQKIYHK
ncbi:hypothetical protein HZS_5964 [Henneguya salminicola]|nr:hypothetical protein HZS_5964 [Henneguya salminicola]